MTDWSFDAWPAVEPKWHDGAVRRYPWDTIDFHVDLGCGTLKKARIGIDRYPAPGVNVLMDLDEGRVHAMAPEPGRDAAERLGNGWRYRTPHGGPSTDGGRGEPVEYIDYPVVPQQQRNLGWQWARPFAEPWTVCNGLPFDDNEIESVITHHALEHIGGGFIPLMDDLYRVLKPGGILRVIVPLFPSYSAVSDADHVRYFMEGTFDAFCGTPGDTPNNCWLASFSVPYTQARFEKLDEDMSPRPPAEKHWTREDAREMRVTLRAMK